MTDPAALFEAMDATWPAVEIETRDGWVLRRGAGGGKRVSAATRLSLAADVSVAERAMQAWGQKPLFQITPLQVDLDAELAARGYRIVDPVSIYVAETQDLLVEGSEVAKILRGDRRIALVEEIWRNGGVDDGRFAVMDRARGPKSFVLTRLGDRPAAVGFVAVAGAVGMVHAIETLPHQRRKGAGALLMAGAARFAYEAGATTLALAVVDAYEPANALYRKLGMSVAARYHYRASSE